MEMGNRRDHADPGIARSGRAGAKGSDLCASIPIPIATPTPTPRAPRFGRDRFAAYGASVTEGAGADQKGVPQPIYHPRQGLQA